MIPETLRAFLAGRPFVLPQGRKRLLGKATIMLGARILALGFAAAGSVWAARCLGPRNLGLSGMVYSVVGQTVVLFNLVHPTLLIREYKKNHSPQKQNRLIRVDTTFTLLLSAVFGLLGLGLQAFGQLPVDYHFAGWFFAPLLILITLQPGWVFQAAEHQHFQSLIAILQPLLAAALYFSFFKPGMSAGADLAVNTTVFLVVTTVYWAALYRLTPFKGFPFKWGDVKYIGGLIRKSRWFFISGLSFYIYTVLEQPLLGWLYSVEELGKYRTAIQVTNVAGSLLGITSTLLFPRFLEWRKKGEEFLWARQVKIGVLFAGFTVAGMLATWMVLPPLYPFVFGEKFEAAAIPAAILVTSKLVAALGAIFIIGLRTDHRYDKSTSIIYMGVAFFSLVSNLLLIPRFGMTGTACVNLASQVVLLAVFLRMSAQRMGEYRKITTGDMPFSIN